MTAHWDSLRRAERFEDIDWQKEYGATADSACSR